MAGKNSFGNILKRLREEKQKKWIERDQWTKVAIVKRIGVSRPTYDAWEDDEKLPEPKNVKRIVEVFQPNEKDELALYRAAAQIPPEVDNLPVSENRFFTAREAYLNQLASHFERGEQIVILWGPFGIGKTELALAYANRYYRTRYRAVFWVDATSKTTIQKSCDEIARRLELYDQRESTGHNRTQAIRQWLQSHTNWLLIIDNDYDHDHTPPFFPDKLLGDVVITTRIGGGVTGTGVVDIGMDVLEPEEGILLMLQSLGILRYPASLDSISPEVRKTVSQLVERLEKYPLLLKQAAIFMIKGNMSLAEYMQFLSNRPHTLTCLSEGYVHVDIGLMDEAGLGSLPIGDKMSFLMYMYTELLVRVRQRRLVLVPKQQVEEFMQLRDANRDKDMIAYLQVNVPNFEEVASDEYAKLKAELIQTAPQILANYQEPTDEQPE